MSYMDVPFPLAYYCKLKRSWPDFGNHILGTYNTRNIILYMSVPRSIGVITEAYQNFRKHGNHRVVDWWLTPSYMSAVNNCNWASLPEQDCLLALTVSRRGFDELLQIAANSKYSGRQVVRHGWEPERDAFGQRTRRENLQLKLRCEMVDTFLDEMLLRIDDVTQFTRRQKNLVYRTDSCAGLMVPREKVYEPVTYYIARELDVDKHFGSDFMDECDPCPPCPPRCPPCPPCPPRCPPCPPVDDCFPECC